MSITRINTNADALLAGANLSKLENSLSKVISHLSSGLRINTGADDPSGVALANKFRTQVSGIKTAQQNVQDALSMMAVADGAMSESADILRRMRDLCVKASNSAVLTSANVESISYEFTQLRADLSRRASSVTFNSKLILDGSVGSFVVQAGPDNGAAYAVTLTISGMTISNLGIATLSFASAAEAKSCIAYVGSALNILSNMQAAVGVNELKLEHVINDLSSQEVNMSSAMSRITDADMAAEISEFTRLQVLSQAATAMLAQANLQPQTVMSLLGASA